MTAPPLRTGMYTLTTTSLRGFQYTRHHEFQEVSQKTIAYTATITRNGREVGAVHNAGRGGADMQTWGTPADRVAFEDTARAEYPDAASASDAVELLSQLLAGMAEITALLRRKRSWVVYVPSDGDVATLRYGRPVRTSSLHRLVATEPDAEVFDKESELYVPVSTFLGAEGA